MTLCTKAEAVNEISKAINILASQQTLVLLSGGSSAEVGVGALANVDKSLRSNITVMLADERFVNYDSPDSNANLLRKLGISRYCKEFIETIKPTGGTLEETVSLFHDNASHFADTSKHVVAVFGVGTDNHIAGILPNSLATKPTDLLVFGYETEKFTRITIGPKFFGNITNAYIYAEGNDKQEVINAINKDENYITHPSQLIKHCRNWNILFNKEKL